ncbi:very-long-chain aldehyde decarbonylase CER1-like isoform X2 [Nicotiana tomentosiformis]|uniref:very-long-chain aldehyde decarbonylase CER1-like isoform X2 n=1 Tax=Nicotiana tomentosiformis TaxID=4098 RepID=UPI001445DAC9|nr:very-long-chain aldehyde decarbonylase CER1-like isoform X2 [Nicotiana tomentosiformis]
MATTPGFLTDWPWKHLGSFKYVILAPWIAHSVYCLATKEQHETDSTNLLILPFLLSRMLHNQLWISFSRYRTAKGNNRIVDKGIEFDQVDRESNWDDQIILNGILLYVFNTMSSAASNLPLWRSDGVIMSIFLHAGPVEFLYYWLHRSLHHHYLYSRYHSHHHSSIATEPITSVIHPFAEHIAYFLLFGIPTLSTVFTGAASLASLFGYITYIDLMNNMGHCNFEFIPKWIFSIFPPLKYFMYTPSFHSLHHTQFRTNYSLFMPIYDYIYGTLDKSTDSIYEKSLKRQEDSPDVVHLTHLTTPESIYHLRLGFSSLASMPQNKKWYIWFMWPLTLWTMITNCIYGRTFILERNNLEKFQFQSWSIPRYNLQYLLNWQSQAINNLIEDAILQAEEKGAKVLSLGLLNQGEELNRNGEIYIERHPKIKIKVVDGSSLAVAVALNSIPKGTTQVFLRGNLTKIAFSIASSLCQRGIQVATLYESDYEKLKLATSCQGNFVLSKTFDQKNWLPRRAMSAPRVAGIVHALEGWDVHECGDNMIDIDKIWEASLKHGFKPLAFAE